MRLWELIESTGNGNMIYIGPPDDYMDDVWKHEVYINGKMVTSGEHFELDGKRFDSVDQFIVALSKEYNVPAEFDLYMLDDDGENPTLSSPGFTPRSSMTNEEEDPYASQTIMDEDPPLGIDYDYANLPKVDWDKYSTKAIKEFLSVIENLDFESGYNSDEFDDTHFNAAQWIEKNVLAKRQDESLGEETIKYEDEYDTPVVIEIDKDKFMYNGNPITTYDWNNSAKSILTPGMHQKAKSWEEVHQYLSRFLGNPSGLQSACRQVFDMNDEGCKVNEAVMVSEAQFDEAAGEKDACYRKVKSRYKVWPSAYASGALVKCRKVGAANWGNSKK